MRHLCLFALAGLVSALTACGGGDGDVGATATTTATPLASGVTEPACGAAPEQATAAAPRIIDLATEQAVSVVWGADSGDFLNDLPALVSGDVNGDGLADILLGARFGDGRDNARPDSGEAYVVFGSEDGPDSVDLAEGEQGLTIYGAEGASALSPNGDQLGFSAAIADVNGDGTDDILLGSPFAPTSGGRAGDGTVYVLFGGSDLGGTTDLAEDAADLTLIGAETSGFFGDSLASSDVNGDGISDIIVGATFGAALRGAAYVIFGANDLEGTRDMARAQYDMAIYGADIYDELGDNVGAGDLNGDGIGDIVITAEAADGPDNARSVAAEVYVVYGSSDLGGVLEITQGQEDVTVYGAEENDTLGFNLAAGDIDGDGTDDIVLTARLADGPGNRVGEAGEIHIIYGSDALPEIIDLAAEESDAYISGPDTADQLGGSLQVADLDADGENELLLGSGYGDGPGNGCNDGGEVYALDAGDLTGAVDLFNTPLKLVVYGAKESDRLGAAMVVSDVNGDGSPELIVLATEGDGPDGSRPDAGQLYIINAAP